MESVGARAVLERGSSETGVLEEEFAGRLRGIERRTREVRASWCL